MNKITGKQRKNNSIQLIRHAISILEIKEAKPTIMQVAKILEGRLGEATIKKYWRIINPKIKDCHQVFGSRMDENINTGQ